MDRDTRFLQGPNLETVRRLYRNLDTAQRLTVTILAAGFMAIAFGMTAGADRFMQLLLILLALTATLMAALSLSDAFTVVDRARWHATICALSAASVGAIGLIVLTPATIERDVTLAVLAVIVVWGIWVSCGVIAPEVGTLGKPIGVVAIALILAGSAAVLASTSFDGPGALLLVSIPIALAASAESLRSRSAWLLVGLVSVGALRLLAVSISDEVLALVFGVVVLFWLLTRHSANRHYPSRHEFGSGEALALTVAVLGAVVCAIFLRDQPVRYFFLASVLILAVALLLDQKMMVFERDRHIKALELRHRDLEIQARLDVLTGLPNRSALEGRLAEEMERSVRYRQPTSICFIDVDHFKTINDTLGHAFGDQMLRAIGEVIRSTIRTPDFVARYGGEEFIVIAPGTWTEDAAILGRRIQTALEKETASGPLGQPLTVSIGVAGVPEHGTDAESVLRLADQALYAAKYAGRNRVEIATVAPASPAP